MQNNPVNYKDPTGHFVETAWDAVSLGWSVADFASEPNLINGFSVVWDAGALIVPGVPAGAGKLLKAGKYTPEVASFAKKIIANGNKVFNKILEYIPSKKVKTAFQNVWAKFKAKFGFKGSGGAPKGNNPKPNPSGGGCFTAGTPVSTKDGQGSIEVVKAGDYVWSANPQTGEKGLKKVINTFIHQKDTLIYVSVGDTMIETTEEHPFWVEGKGWIFAGELNEGDMLRLKSDVNVKDWHTYFVSDITVLVHNKAAKYKAPIPMNSKKVDTNYLKINGVDPHLLKYDTLGDGAEISKYNIFVDKEGGLWLQKNGSKEFIPTYESIGR